MIDFYGKRVAVFSMDDATDLMKHCPNSEEWKCYAIDEGKMRIVRIRSLLEAHEFFKDS